MNRDEGPLNRAYNPIDEKIRLPSALHAQSKWALEQFHQVWPKKREFIFNKYQTMVNLAKYEVPKKYLSKAYNRIHMNI